MKQAGPSFLWILRMAWRDGRSALRRLWIYMIAIALGVAALVAITSFRANLQQSIDQKAQTLLGADLMIESHNPTPQPIRQLLDSTASDSARMVEFASMARSPKTNRTRLSRIRAIDGPFPFYGSLQTQPADASKTFRSQRDAVVDKNLLMQLDIEIGDTLQLGYGRFRVAGTIQKVPGQAAASSMLGPRIFIGRQFLGETRLIQTGSRIEYKTYAQIKPGVPVDTITARLDGLRDNYRFHYETIESQKEDFGEAIDNLARFLNLVGFIALLLGGIGVASAVYVYIQRKVETVAVLRCLGATGRQALAIYALQTSVMGFLGAAAGALIGVAVQFVLPHLFGNLLPVDVELFISWPAVGLGLLIGTLSALLFSIPPLWSVRSVSPLHTLRSIDPADRRMPWWTRITFGVMIFGAIAAYAILLTREWEAGLGFTATVAVGLLLLWGVAKLLMLGVRRFFPSHWPYVWRQGLANLYRPHNQTVTLMATLGLGVLLISTLFFSQQMLLNQLEFSAGRSKANLVFFDIQPDQVNGTLDVLKENDAPVMQNVPIVTMRLQSINGRSVDVIMQDTAREARHWALRREYRSTYRDSLAETEELVKGTLTDSVSAGTSPVPISLADEIREDLAVDLGDTLTFNVQGIPIETVVGSIRKIDWQRVSPNFFVVFPKGVLEQAPRFNVMVTAAQTDSQSVAMQQQVVQKYPNISAIDLSLILSTVEDFLDQIAYVIRFMALFSIGTGLLVLAGAIATSRRQRMRESVLLRTIGASRRQILTIMTAEYLFLGLLAALTGLLISVGASILLAWYYFDLVFVPNGWFVLAGIVLTAALTLGVGVFNSRGIYQRPPLEVLRAEAT